MALLEYTEKNMHLSFHDTGRNEQHEIAQKVIAYLKNEGSEQSYKRLLFKFSSDVTKKEFDELMTDLEITNQVMKNGNGYRINEQFKEEQL